MTTAVASSQPPAVAQKTTAAATRAEVKLISLLAGGLVVLGVLLQLFIAPGAVAFVVYTTLMTVTLVATAYVVRGRLLDAVAGFRLAAVALTILGLGAALGTLVLQNKPADFYRGLGGVGGLILALRLDDLFHSFWYGGVIALMNTGLVASAVRRWPVTRRNVGFFMVHLGIIVTLVGAGVSAVFAVKGRIDLRVGQSASTVNVTKSGLPSPAEVPLNASVQLLDFDVDHYADVPRLRLFLPARKGSGYDLKASFEGEVGVLHKLPGGNAFRAKAFYPDLVQGEKLVETGGDKPALKLSVDGTPTWLMAASGERQRVDTKDGKVAVVFGWQRPAVKIDGPLHTVKGEKSSEAVPVHLGETVTVDGMKVTALRYFPQFTYDLSTKTAVNLSDRPINPALEVDIDGKTHKWLFANMPGFGHGEGPNLTYAFAPEGGSSAATVLAVAGIDRTVLVHKPDGTEQTVPLTDGLELEGVKFGALLEKASVSREPTTASQEMKNPALLVEVTNEGLTREVMMMAGQKDPVEVGNGFLTFETRVDDVKAFRSSVAVRTGTAGEARKAIVEVNSPVDVADWKLYQVNYDPKDPTYSGFEAVRDPGVNWVFVGFGLLFSGVFYMIYVGPRMRRKEA